MLVTFHCCDKIPEKSNLKGGKIIWADCFNPRSSGSIALRLRKQRQNIVVCGGEGNLPHSIQESLREKKGSRTMYTLQGHTPVSDFLQPITTSCFLPPDNAIKL
jgi:hypothetical protein